MAEQISNYDVYLSRMEASLKEKLYFTEYLHDKVTTFVDFGCADGALLGVLSELYPSANLVGIDNDSHMLELTSKRLGNRVAVYRSLDEYKRGTSRKNRRGSVLILSSVLHELFSYLSRQEYETEIYKMFHLGFKQIFIRDMAVSGRLYLEIADIEDVEKIEKHPLCDEYEDYLGHRVNTKQELYHFLLKYRYEDNWSRELRENYLKYSLEEIVDYLYRLSGSTYELEKREHELLAYTKGVVKEDFGIAMIENTNYKLVFTRKAGLLNWFG